jgi:hypothetical protein
MAELAELNADLAKYLHQLSEVEDALQVSSGCHVCVRPSDKPPSQIDPKSKDHRELKAELEELVQLSRDLITEYHNTHAAAPKKASSLAQMAAIQGANQGRR